MMFAVSLLLASCSLPQAQAPSTPPPAVAPSVRIEGIVVDTHQQPVPAAEVWLEQDDAVVARVRSDATGWFAFSPLPRASRVLHARVPGRAAGAAAMSEVGSDSAFARMTLLPVRSVRGVVRGPDGQPRGNAWVLAVPEDDSEFAVVTATARTAADGSYELREVLPGPVSVWAWAAGCALERQRDATTTAAVVDFALAAPKPSIVLRLDGAADDRARTTFHCRGECRNAPLPFPRELALLQPDADGVVRIDGLGDDVRLVVERVEAPRRVVSPRSARALPLVEHELEFAVRDCGELRGALVDDRGRGIAGCALAVWPAMADGALTEPSFLDERSELQATAADAPVWVVTDAQGTFALSAPVDFGQDCELRAVDDAWIVQPNDGAASLAGCWRGTHDRSLHTVHARRGAVRTLRCTDSGDRPLGGLELDIVDGRNEDRVQWLGGGHTDATGVARLAPLDLADAALPLLLVRGNGRFVLRALPENGVDAIQLVDAGAIAGRVVDAAGKPCAGARVRVRVTAHGVNWVRFEQLVTITDADGNYRFTGVPTGEHLLAFAHEDSERLTEPVLVEAGAVTSKELRLR